MSGSSTEPTKLMPMVTKDTLKAGPALTPTGDNDCTRHVLFTVVTAVLPEKMTKSTKLSDHVASCRL